MLGKCTKQSLEASFPRHSHSNKSLRLGTRAVLRDTLLRARRLAEENGAVLFLNEGLFRLRVRLRSKIRPERGAAVGRARSRRRRLLLRIIGLSGRTLIGGRWRDLTLVAGCVRAGISGADAVERTAIVVVRIV